jgi:hypothetical protein
MPFKSKERRNEYFRDYYARHPELKDYHRIKEQEYYKKKKEVEK